MKIRKSYRISRITQMRLNCLKERWGMNETEVIERCIQLSTIIEARGTEPIETTIREKYGVIL